MAESIRSRLRAGRSKDRKGSSPFALTNFMAKPTPEFYQRCLAKWGREGNLRQLQEECGELVAAINQYLRPDRTESDDHVIKEIVDVHLMIEQMKTIFDPAKIDLVVDKVVDDITEELSE